MQDPMAHTLGALLYLVVRLLVSALEPHFGLYSARAPVPAPPESYLWLLLWSALNLGSTYLPSLWPLSHFQFTSFLPSSLCSHPRRKRVYSAAEAITLQCYFDYAPRWLRLTLMSHECHKYHVTQATCTLNLWCTVYLSDNACHFPPSEISFANLPQHTPHTPCSENRDHRLQIHLRIQKMNISTLLWAPYLAVPIRSLLLENVLFWLAESCWCILTWNLFLVKLGVIVLSYCDSLWWPELAKYGLFQGS